jgi:hypothetical protein
MVIRGRATRKPGIDGTFPDILSLCAQKEHEGTSRLERVKKLKIGFFGAMKMTK